MTQINFKPSTDEVVVAGMFAAISIVFQVVHIGFPSPIGMWVDLVGIPWLLAYFLKGFRTALLTAVIATIVIALVCPTGPLGASMKFVATVPMFFIPALSLYASKQKKHLKDIKFASFALFPALLVRLLITLPLNVYFAIPIWTGVSFETAVPEMIKRTIDFCNTWGLTSVSTTLSNISSGEAILVLLAFLAVLNIIQGIFEFGVAWFLSFKTQLNKLEWD